MHWNNEGIVCGQELMQAIIESDYYKSMAH